MNVIFVDNLLIYQDKFIDNVPLDPHLGLMSLVSVARSAGHDARIYDPKMRMAQGRLCYDDSLYFNMAAEIEELSPDVVGFTALGCNFICVVKVASYLKRKNPDCRSSSAAHMRRSFIEKSSRTSGNLTS